MIHSTIAAISTPHGRGGIAVIRISGEEAVRVGAAVFRPFGKRQLESLAPNEMVHGAIYADGRRIDDGMAVVFRAPRSYTGEDTVEISCHGGILLSQLVLESALRAGAEMAGPGEFTRRAFLNGKLGLTQAEAVIDLIDAESEEKIRLKSAQTRGVLEKRIASLRERILVCVSSVYASIDFPDEDMTDFSVEELRARLIGIRAEVDRLADTYRAGRAIGEGIDTLIVGKPNTGKSSLLNLLLGEERAIVTSHAGTTRDTIEETAVLGKVLLRLCDTAGIHPTSDEVERIGIDRVLARLPSAPLILAVFDGSAPLDAEDMEVLALLERMQAENPEGEILLVCNKADCPASGAGEALRARFGRVLSLSCKTGAGRDALIEAVNALYIDGEIDYDHTAVVSGARQRAGLRSASDCLGNAIAALDAGMTQDIAGMDLEHALARLAEIDGRSVTEEIVDDIFHRFCVGK